KRRSCRSSPYSFRGLNCRLPSLTGGLPDQPIEEGLELGVGGGAVLGVELDTEDRAAVGGFDALDDAVAGAAVDAKSAADVFDRLVVEAVDGHGRAVQDTGQERTFLNVDRVGQEGVEGVRVVQQGAGDLRGDVLDERAAQRDVQ